MNKSTPYEQLIAAKLEQISVPDMADDIWNSIETQLNATIETPDSKPSKKFSGKGNYGYLGSIVLSVVLTAVGVYYGTKVPEQKTDKTEIKIPIIEVPKQEKNIAPPMNPVKEKPPVKSPSAAPIPNVIKTDSVAEHKSPERRFDSIALPPVIYIPQVIDSPAIYIQPKKPKGIKGISADDYRISVDKDTLKNEE